MRTHERAYREALFIASCCEMVLLASIKPSYRHIKLLTGSIVDVNACLEVYGNLNHELFSSSRRVSRDCRQVYS